MMKKDEVSNPDCETVLVSFFGRSKKKKHNFNNFHLLLYVG